MDANKRRKNIIMAAALVVFALLVMASSFRFWPYLAEVATVSGG